MGNNLLIILTLSFLSLPLIAKDPLDKKDGTEVWNQKTEPYKGSYDPKKRALFDQEYVAYNKEQRYFSGLQADSKKTKGRSKVIRYYGWRKAIPSGSIFIDKTMHFEEKQKSMRYNSMQSKPVKNSKDVLDFSAFGEMEDKKNQNKKKNGKKIKVKKPFKPKVTKKEEASLNKAMKETEDSLDLEKDLGLELE